MASEIVVAAPAKVNLALHVTGRRTDGYHLIETVVVFAGPHDRVTARPAAADRFAVSGPFAGALDPAAPNLVTAARDRLRRLHGAAASAPVALSLQKNLPVAAGIGGGSADGAAALVALDRLWGLGLGPAALAEAALPLGADLPICLAGVPLEAGGIGETVEPIASFPELPMVLVNPGVPVATAAVFAGLERRDNEGLPARPGLADVAAVLEWLRRTRNDLEAPARRLAPAIDAALKLLDDAGAAFSRMSGSGATCFGLFPDSAAAAAAAAAIAAAEPGWFVRATVGGGAKGAMR